MTARYDKHVSGLLPVEIWLAFIERCSALGISHSEGVRQAVAMWVEAGVPGSNPLMYLRSRIEQVETALDLYQRAQKLAAKTGDASYLDEARRLAEELGVRLDEQS